MSLPLKLSSKYMCLWFICIFSLCLCISTTRAEETPAKETSSKDPAPFAGIDTFYEGVEEKVEKGIKLPLLGPTIYWDKGLHIDGRYKNFLFRVGGSFILDIGNIDSDAQIQRAFPELDGSRTEFRQARILISALVVSALEIRLDVDFANTKAIKDNWIRFTTVPVLNRFRFGHIKEPFSLEEMISSRNTTFMERALPVDAFSPGRNFGIRYDRAIPDKRLTWGAGVFLNTSSFSNFRDAGDAIDETNGYNITFRVTGLPVYSEVDKRLLHVGISYLHHWKADEAQIRAYPESRLTDDTMLVSTGKFKASGSDIINPEFAYVNGPLSVQGEYFHTFVDTVDEDLQFWGFYLYGSYFITGEHREYSTGGGTFSGINIKNDFHPRQGKWGAFEFGLRLSYLDLNDKFIKGGKERNITLGLNWYLFPEIRCMFNYIHANVRDRRAPLIENGDSDIFMVRLQFSF